MTGLTVKPIRPDPVAFAPYGRLVVPPDKPYERQFYSDALLQFPRTSAPVLHVNHVLPQGFPIKVSGVERHPYAAQCFLPLDVARYVALVMPSDDTGSPCADRALAIMMPGTTGVIFNPGVWHLGATVLDRPGHFAVLMWRGGAMPDDEFRSITPLTLIDPT